MIPFDRRRTSHVYKHVKSTALHVHATQKRKADDPSSLSLSFRLLRQNTNIFHLEGVHISCQITIGQPEATKQWGNIHEYEA